jgi:S-adenosylmethionine:tRNA ribosyltransferase-isomerase
MKTEDFYFDLPQELIAQYPLPNRSDSRLLSYNRQQNSYEHFQFHQLPNLLEAGDLLVMNNSKVIPARFYGKKESGGRVEFLLERIQDDNHFLAHIKASKSPKPGSIIYLNRNWMVRVESKIDDLYHCCALGDLEIMLQEIGHIPLPPYITREDETLDTSRYQTVYALHQGSVAAPTAGLHFDEFILDALKNKGIELAYLTLHVGAGTFRPVRCEQIKDHKMHSEYFTIDNALCESVAKAKAAGKKIIAVGTTALRSLESAALEGSLRPCKKETNIFIYPGYQFQICNGLITNFHLPESTLLMLVSAFIGHKEAMALYQEAISQKYRFFSYGDASLLL